MMNLLSRQFSFSLTERVLKTLTLHLRGPCLSYWSDARQEHRNPQSLWPDSRHYHGTVVDFFFIKSFFVCLFFHKLPNRKGVQYRWINVGCLRSTTPSPITDRPGFEQGVLLRTKLAGISEGHSPRKLQRFHANFQP